jgi:segregation and condensation protein A
VSISHIHQVRVSVPEHARLLRERLRRAGSATFTLLVADCENTLEVVARFLALLELYRQNLIDFEQPVSLDELTVRWIGGDDTDGELEVDDYEGTRPDPDAPPAESVTDADLLAGAATSPDADELDADELDEDEPDDDLDDELVELPAGDEMQGGEPVSGTASGEDHVAAGDVAVVEERP